MKSRERFFRKLGNCALLFLFLVTSALIWDTSAGYQSQGSLILNCHVTTDFFLGALTESDMVLLINGGVVSGALMEEMFPFEMQGNLSSFKRDDVIFILVGQGANESDRLLKGSGELLSGRLRLDRIRMKTVTGEQIALEKAQLRATVLQLRPDTEKESKDTENDKARKIFQGPVGSALFSLMLQSPTQGDLVVMTDRGLMLSVAILEETFVFQPQGQARVVNVKKDDIAALFIGPPLDWVILKTGNVLQGTLQATAFRGQPAYSSKQVQLSRTQVKVIIFQMLPAQCAV